ncbi:MAG: BadF/BadG/BcrA/BcrD ATPase family protein, partial [Acidobacteriota bacterium]
MKYSVGIDLGSTTTKAVILGESGEVLGSGITNSRSNYEVACDVAMGEALLNVRFSLLAASLEAFGIEGTRRAPIVERIALEFRAQQYISQLATLRETILGFLEPRVECSPLRLVDDAGQRESPDELRDAAGRVLDRMRAEVPELYAAGAERKSDFFRDLAGSRYLSLAEGLAAAGELSFDRLAGLFDKAIIKVENRPPAEDDFETRAVAALGSDLVNDPALAPVVREAASIPLEKAASAGTGYGRRTLPFAKEEIRSEILCHGLGAHAMFPLTRTVLDIGGQDTKAIQVDENGIVTSFQMNDRCAAGCGRYLGYIADEMNIGVHELGPMACKSKRPVRINSTCTVFAGAELRERLSLGEKREDILAGLHRAIILRAMSLIARSGGARHEFTFTGGVARNEAAVRALRTLIHENY